MKNFIKEAMGELEHVVWPTENETRTYLVYNLATIVFLTILLVCMGYLIRNGLMYTRNQFPHTAITDTNPATSNDIDNLIKDIKVETGANSVKTIDTTTPAAPTGSGN